MIKRILLLTALTFLFTACPVPDVSKFSEATSKMAEAIKNSARETLDLLTESYENQEIEQDIFENEEIEKKDYPKEIKKKWKVVDQTLGAMVDYSDALSSISKSGENGKESFNNLANSLNDLAGVVGIAPISVGATEIGKFVYGEIAEIRSANTLKQVIYPADTTIQVIAGELIKNLQALRNLNFAAETILLTQHFNNEEDAYNNYYNSLVKKELKNIKKITLINNYESGDPESLVSFILEDALSRYKLNLIDLSLEIDRIVNNSDLSLTEKIEEINKLNEKTKPLIREKLLSKDPGMVSSKTILFSRYDLNNKVISSLGIEYRLKTLQNELSFLRKEIEKYDKIIEAFDQREIKIRDLAKTNNRLIEKSIKAVQIWQNKHSEMRNFFDKKQKISFENILSISTEINDTYDQYINSK